MYGALTVASPAAKELVTASLCEKLQDENRASRKATTTGVTTGDAVADACAGLEGTAGCTQLGTPDGSPVVATQSIDFAVDSLGLPAACPAPLVQTFPVVGSVSFAFTPLCDIAPAIRLAFLALAALSAAGVIVLSVSRS